MSRMASSFVLVASTVAVLSVAACSAGEIAVGRTDQQLQTRKDGKPTGNGQTCSWDDTVAYEVATGKETTTPAPNGPYNVGDTFPSLDGCNDCSCANEGIMCTRRACAGDPGGPACTDEALICPDGSSVGRTGPNCEFAPCPGAPPAGTVDESKLGPSCADDFLDCPAGQSCSSFPTYGFRCSSDPCAALTCPGGTVCMILESFPSQIACGK